MIAWTKQNGLIQQGCFSILTIKCYMQSEVLLSIGPAKIENIENIIFKCVD